MSMKLYVTLACVFLASITAAQSRRVVCYFPDWAGYRNGDGKFSPQEFDTSKCTNVLYAFGLLDSDSVTIKPADAWADISLNYYKQIVEKSKASNAKPSLALGGWNDSGGNKYSILLNSPTNRQKFVQNAVKFLQTYGFEGLDLDIEYPSCPQGNCAGGNPNDKAGFGELIKELKKEFQPRGWVVSAAINGYKDTVDRAYPVKEMSQYLDWIGVMTYDYHMPSESQTGPVSPLRTTKGDKFPNLNTESSINYLVSLGADKSKLLVGVPFYGYSFKLQNPSNNGYWAPSSGRGISGPYTNSPGTLAYYEICNLIKTQGYKKVENNALGAYAYNGDNWISYNSQNDVMNKVNYVKQSNLGGVIIWDVSFDDFKGKFCGLGNNPLLTAIKNNIN